MYISDFHSQKNTIPILKNQGFILLYLRLLFLLTTTTEHHYYQLFLEKLHQKRWFLSVQGECSKIIDIAKEVVHFKRLNEKYVNNISII